MQTPQQQVIQKCNEVFAKAKELYGVDLSVVRVGFNLKGRVAGWAAMKGRIGGPVAYSVRFNYDMLARGCEDTLKDMLEDTVPHELAHIVCFMKPALGKNHDEGWKRVCEALGGTRARTHKLEVVFGKGTTYEYTTDAGHKVRLNERRHTYIQGGGVLTYRKNMGRVMKGCAYSIVGHQGRTLQAPIVKQAETVLPADAFKVNRITLVGTGSELLQKLFPPTAPVVLRTPTKIVPTAPVAGESKAAVSRRLMLSGFKGGKSYESIIAEMMAANGYDRQLARGTFKANAPKVGIPTSFYL